MAHDPTLANLRPRWPTSIWEVGQRNRLITLALANLANLANVFRGYARACARVVPLSSVPDYLLYLCFRLARLARLAKANEINGLLWPTSVQRPFRGRPGWPTPRSTGPSPAVHPCDVDAARHFASRGISNLTEHPEHDREHPNTPWRRLRLSTLSTLSTRSGNPPHWENPAPHSRRRDGGPGKDPRPSARPHGGHSPHHRPAIHLNLRGSHGHRRSS